MSIAENIYYTLLPPTVSTSDAEHIVQKFDTDTTAAACDWWGGLSTNAPKGKCFVHVEAATKDAFVRFGRASTTGTTANNGRLVKADQVGITFYVDPITHRYMDVIAPGGAGTIKIQVSSPIGERRDI